MLFGDGNLIIRNTEIINQDSRRQGSNSCIPTSKPA